MFADFFPATKLNLLVSRVLGRIPWDFLCRQQRHPQIRAVYLLLFNLHALYFVSSLIALARTYVWRKVTEQTLLLCS